MELYQVIKNLLEQRLETFEIEQYSANSFDLYLMYANRKLQLSYLRDPACTLKQQASWIDYQVRWYQQDPTPQLQCFPEILLLDKHLPSANGTMQSYLKGVTPETMLARGWLKCAFEDWQGYKGTVGWLFLPVAHPEYPRDLRPPAFNTHLHYETHEILLSVAKAMLELEAVVESLYAPDPDPIVLPEHMTLAEVHEGANAAFTQAQTWIADLNLWQDTLYPRTCNAVTLAVHSRIPLSVAKALLPHNTGGSNDMRVTRERAEALLPFLPLLRFSTCMATGPDQQQFIHFRDPHDQATHLCSQEFTPALEKLTGISVS